MYLKSYLFGLSWCNFIGIKNEAGSRVYEQLTLSAKNKRRFWHCPVTQHSHDTRSHQLLIDVTAASDCLVDLKISSISSVIWCQMVYCVPP